MPPCKAAEVALAELRLADGLGGKAYFIVAGEQADVEAALFAAEHATRDRHAARARADRAAARGSAATCATRDPIADVPAAQFGGRDVY